jgi:hypothetical protein
MTKTNGSDRDPIDVGQPEESELAEQELTADRPAPPEMPEEDRADEELEPLKGGAETMADMEDEERPHESTEAQPQKPQG